MADLCELILECQVLDVFDVGRHTLLHHVTEAAKHGLALVLAAMKDAVKAVLKLNMPR